MPEITCVIRSSIEPEYRVDAVGGLGWTKPVSYVIREIDDGLPYFVHADETRMKVEVMYDRVHPYLRTDPDMTVENGLLWLPECREPGT